LRNEKGEEMAKNKMAEIENFDEQSFVDICTLIVDAKKRIYTKANSELIDLYWNIGKYIQEKILIACWGKGIVKNLSDYILEKIPDSSGFSAQNLWRMKQFYQTYQNDTKLSTLLRELSWSKHLHIMSHAKTVEEREFYITLCIKEHYSVRELERQLKSSLFHRITVSDKKLSTLLREMRPETDKYFRDSYTLEFLDLPSDYKEIDLRAGIVQNLKKFILEFGKDFAFVGEEYRVQVGNHDFFIDLLFFHRGLSCLVPIELKIDEFKPEYLGKMNFYLEALDRDVKKDHENPSVGILLCASKDSDVVEYAMSRSISPTMVAEYQTKLIDKKLLENKLHELHLLSEKEDNIYEN
jgi:predicted nuclease of restriction endonuclease-like (RecB) superfamily